MTATAFETVMRELDTLPDLLHYLRKREELLKDKRCYLLPSKDEAYEKNVVQQFMDLAHGDGTKPGFELLVSGSEQDLLASYLFNERSFPDSYRPIGFDHGAIDCEGEWLRYINSPEVIRKKWQDRASYFVDDLVRKEVLQHQEGVPIATELMALGRFHRRVVGKACVGFFRENNERSGMYYARRYLQTDQFGLLIVYYGEDLAKREDLNDLIELTISAYIYRRGYPRDKVILIATTKDWRQFRIGFRQGIKPFSKEYEAFLDEQIKDLEWFTDENTRPFHETEYPKE